MKILNPILLGKKKLMEAASQIFQFKTGQEERKPSYILKTIWWRKSIALKSRMIFLRSGSLVCGLNPVHDIQIHIDGLDNAKAGRGW